MEEKTESKETNMKQIVPLLLTAFITSFMGSALNLSIPAISKEFSAGAVTAGWIVTVFLLSSTALLVPFGRIADLYGKKKMFVLGLVLLGAFSALCVISSNIVTMIIFRACQGIGASMLFATNTAMIASNFPQSMRGQLMGFSVMCTYIGLSTGPVLGGFLNHHLGWRSIFIFAALYCVLCFATSVTMLDDDSRQMETARGGAEGKLDIPGCFLYTVTAALFLYGLTDITTSAFARLMFICSLALLVLFVYVEKRTENPVLDITMFTGSRTFTLSNAAALLNYGASFSISYLMSLYFQTVRGMDSDIAGLVLVTTPLMQAILSPVAGRLSDSHSPYKLASAGMLLTCAGIVMLIFIGQTTAMPYIIAALAVVGVGFGLFSSPNTNAIMSSAERSKYGVASSIMSASRTIGQTASMAVVTAVFGVVLGNVQLSSADPASMVSALGIEFAVSAVLCAVGIFCSAKR